MNAEFEIRTAQTADFSMDYVVFGDGKKNLVILPGVSVQSITLSAGAIASAYAPRFAETYTVYVLDVKKGILPGYSVDDMASDVGTACGLIGIASADFFGVSMGGMILERLAIRYPRLVHKAVLGSTVARQNDTTAEVFSKLRELAVSQNVRALNRMFFECVYSEETLRQYADAMPVLETVGTPDEMRRFAILMQAVQDFDTYAELEMIRCPVLVIGTRSDRVVSGNASVEIARKLNCELYMYDGYGHAVYDEAPDYKERLYRFFTDRKEF